MSEHAPPEMLERVLIICDEAARARRLVALAEVAGFEAVTRPDATEADAVPEADCVVAVVDERCLTPKTAELVAAIRRIDPAFPVIVDTGHGFPGVTTDSDALTEFAPIYKVSDHHELTLGLQRAARECLARRLRDTEEMLARIFTASKDGILVIDPTREEVVDANPSAAELLGFSPGEMCHMGAARILPDALEGLRRLARDSHSAGRVYTLELDCRGREGARIPVEISACVLVAGGARRILVMLRDLSQRKRAEEALTESEERLRGVFDHSPVAIDLKDTDGRYLLVNQNYSALHGGTTELFAGSHTRERHAPELANALSAHEAAVLRSGKAIEREYRLVVDGTERTYLVVKFPIADAQGGVAAIGGIGTDITERKHAETALTLTKERFQGLYDHAPDMYFTVAEDGTVMSVNQFGADYLGYTKETLIGKPLWGVVHVDDRSLVQEQFGGAFGESLADNGIEFRMVRRDGTLLWVHGRIRLLAASATAPAELRLVCRDVTQAHDLSEELSYQATHDALTALVNRRELEQRLARVLETARNDESEHALCYVDLDQFKVINDTCGHIAGDELLRQIAEVLRAHVRKRDTLARLGGDEFGVLMEHCNLEQAQRVANALRKGVEGFRFTWESKSFSVGASIGLVPISGDSESVASALSAADAACYVAKDQGRNRIHVYHPEDAELVRRHGEMQWVSRITQALEEDRFCLSVQPIEPVAGEEPEAADGRHYELLLRMRDENGRLVPPGAFLPAAERYNLTTKLDRWVVEEVFDWLDAHPPHLERLSLCSLNISGHSVADEEFLQFVIAKFDETSVPAEKLCFEITETAAIRNLTSATRFITALKGWGCRFALDDFGSGLSSFAYLKHLDVDFLKIDGVFVKDIDGDAISLAMVKSINEIGKVMGKRTIAEFVESEAVLARLREVGVDYVQGYRIGRPKPLERLMAEPEEPFAKEEPLRPTWA